MAKKLLLLLLLVISSTHANSGSIVKFLPGFNGPLPFELETGYIGVGEEEQVQLFYYFIKSEKKPKEDPLLLWLSGGPGCSSISGLLLENGPVTLKADDGYEGGSPILLSTTYSWTKVASIVFLDQPVGTGFSYSKTQLVDTPSDSGEAKRIHEFLRKWLSKHAEFISNPFYIGGDSYSGKVIPVTVQEISQGNDLGLKPQINLQGYVLGNPATDAEFDNNHRIPFAHGMALISDELYESLKRSCRGNYEKVDPRNTECLKLVQEYFKCISRVNHPYILEPRCAQVSSPRRYTEELLFTNLRDVPITDKCYILNLPNGPMTRACAKHFMWSSGDHDLQVPYTATQAWISSLNYSIVDKWRPWFIHDQVVGYTQTYANNMTFVTVKGGGHTATFKPKESSIMFQRWISGQPL